MAEACSSLDRKVYRQELDTVVLLPSRYCMISNDVNKMAQSIFIVFYLSFIQWKELALPQHPCFLYSQWFVGVGDNYHKVLGKIRGFFVNAHLQYDLAPKAWPLYYIAGFCGK